MFERTNADLEVGGSGADGRLECLAEVGARAELSCTEVEGE